MPERATGAVSSHALPPQTLQGVLALHSEKRSERKDARGLNFRQPPVTKGADGHGGSGGSFGGAGGSGGGGSGGGGSGGIGGWDGGV